MKAKAIGAMLLVACASALLASSAISGSEAPRQAATVPVAGPAAAQYLASTTYPVSVSIGLLFAGARR